MDLNDILIKCDGFNFVENNSVANRTITLEDLLNICQDLYYENQRLEEQIEELEQDIEDNYIKRPQSDYTGDFEDDRY
ncbi:MAG: hypothetical protein IJZ77_04930 [Bacilli bacterium]|nr:hypothetical protein [Bacilli bacterium]